MEDMGQMGNAEEATIPDGIPFNIDDLELEDEPMEMQVGGFVQPTSMVWCLSLTIPAAVYARSNARLHQPTMPAYTPPNKLPHLWLLQRCRSLVLS